MARNPSRLRVRTASWTEPSRVQCKRFYPPACTSAVGRLPRRVHNPRAGRTLKLAVERSHAVRLRKSHIGKTVDLHRPHRRAGRVTTTRIPNEIRPRSAREATREDSRLRELRGADAARNDWP